MDKLFLSPLSKTWILDVDGTILKHNGYKHGGDVVLPGVKETFSKFAKEDKIILLTARKKEQKNALENFLKINKIRFDEIIFEVPVGERILINDSKPSGLITAIAIPKGRDSALNIEVIIDPTK
ncbi:MAG: hypothetical protein ACLS7H_06630 [Parasutterella sp.]|uniref:hypothetical protein n=1 Tax=Parasutterella sp. TaxID=2049037 RepID=UPI0039949D70